MAKSPTNPQKIRAVLAVLGGNEIGAEASSLGVQVDELQSWVAAYQTGGSETLRQMFPPRSRAPRNPPPDPTMTTVAEALGYANPKAGASTFGYYLSNALAVVLANGLRSLGFEGVLPDERGGFESRSRSARGLKKLDVNYSTPEMGLGLGLSIKTISAPDPETKRFTKNYSRNDNELRAEAMDYHRRQPYAVLAGFLFMPTASCEDAGRGKDEDTGVSSFGAAVRYFSLRTPRPDPEDEPDLFEAFYVCVYDEDGETLCWPAHHTHLRPPKSGVPSPPGAMSLNDALADAVKLYDERNNPFFHFA